MAVVQVKVLPYVINPLSALILFVQLHRNNCERAPRARDGFLSVS